MVIVKLSKTNQNQIINKTIGVLSSGGLVVFPTDTVYGLLADATNPKAIDKLLAFKERPPGKAISVFVSDEKMAEKYVVINQNAKNIIKNLLPGPFTVICAIRSENSEDSENQPIGQSDNQKFGTLKNPILRQSDSPTIRVTSEFSENISSLKRIDPRLLAENNTLGFRIPDYPLINDLLMAYGLPLTATSANISSTPPHYSIESFLKSCGQTLGSAPTYPAGCHPVGTKDPDGILRGKAPLNDKKNRKLPLIDLIIDAGKLPKNKPSTVIDTTTGQLKTLRFGDLLPATPNSLISKSEKESKSLAGFILTKALKKSLGKPIVFLLEGELGAGKTIFTKGLGKALKIKDEIVSPTFTICYEYRIMERDSSAHCDSVGMTTASRHPERPRCASGESRDPFFPEAPRGISTENDQLSTDSPILYQPHSDIERVGLNSQLLHQECKSSIKKQVLSLPAGKAGIKENNEEKNLLNANYLILNTSLLVHYDLYRVETKEELEEIGFLDSIQPGNIYSIEWPERINKETLKELKKKSCVIYIKIKHRNEKEREIEWGQ